MGRLVHQGRQKLLREAPLGRRKGAGAAGVDDAHERHLDALLIVVALVEADLVDEDRTTVSTAAIVVVVAIIEIW
ncbi:MAG: hypothetical protein B7X76_11400 [Azorhizobium sp. 39-67-5]|nr:MAG: hypothetical protein B7X76_11400 [Azorhizobium sp. 39-67-5]